MHKVIVGKAGNFKNSGSVIMNEFVIGIKSQTSKISSTIMTALSSSVTVIRNYYSSFYSAGSYVAEGFANGISANAYMAKAKATAMANAAYEAAKDALDINSPSKVFRRLAYSIPEGFAQGIDRMGKCVEQSSIGMAGKAIRGTENALEKVAYAINTGMDSQPTIRPVLDLSGVKTGISAVGDLFNDRESIGVSANVNAVSSLMSKHGQNGKDSEVVSAINKLRKDLENVGGPSYVVNGITYDDGSNISGAVKDLIRAARVERRI